MFKQVETLLLPNGCRIAVESPERSEDLQRIAGTKAEATDKADSHYLPAAFVLLVITPSKLLDLRSLQNTVGGYVLRCNDVAIP